MPVHFTRFSPGSIGRILRAFPHIRAPSRLDRHVRVRENHGGGAVTRTERSWLIVLIAACFIGLVFYIVVNDANYRLENRYRDIRIETHDAYSSWYRYVGSLRGLLLTNAGFESALDEAGALEEETLARITALRTRSGKMDRDIRAMLSDFIDILEAGLRLGRELEDNGRLLLSQEDLPGAYREGRVALSSLSGKDVTREMGRLSAYQYYQLVRRLKDLNSVFDRIYYERLDRLLRAVELRSRRIALGFFAFRMAVLAGIAAVAVVLVARLLGINRSLKRAAETTETELASARSDLDEAQGLLYDAEFQNSLVKMIAGLSHELNTPLGNCLGISTHMDYRLKEFARRVAAGDAGTGDFLEGLDEGLEGFALLRTNLEQMRSQVDTFRKLSSVREALSSAVLPLSEYVRKELPRIAASRFPALSLATFLEGAEDPAVRFGDLNQILEQLLDNSVAHGNPSRVEIRFRTGEGTLAVEYSDDGGPLAEEILERLAEPFFTTARGRNHMGLGIPIVVSLVATKLQGAIRFGNGDRGIRVTMSLPLRYLSS